MRYVIILVAIGLLVVGTGGFYTAEAAQSTQGIHLISPIGKATLSFEKLNDAHAKYVALKEEERKQREAEQRRAEAINRFGPWGPDLVDAGAMYGQDPSGLYSAMSCESKGDEYADNGVDKGLMQFDPDTFAGTPYGGASIWDGHAQIYAAAWMWSQGRRGEWPVCGRL